MTKIELQEILKNHELWLKSEGKEGLQADLSGADLSGADRPEGLDGYEINKDGYILSKRSAVK